LQLEAKRADREEIEGELLPAKAKFCSGYHNFGKLTPNAPKILSQFRATRKKYRYARQALDSRL
jgi:hypothetical protein